MTDNNERWHTGKKSMVTSVKASEFLDDLHKLYLKHGLTISHEDGQGGFILNPYHPYDVRWINDCSIDGDIDD